jgi:hypothetical protein
MQVGMSETYPPRACRKADHNRISDQRIILDSNRREDQRGGRTISSGRSHPRLRHDLNNYGITIHSFSLLRQRLAVRMFSARGFINRRITAILMFRTWGNLEARIFDNHAASTLLALNMHLLLFNTISVPHVSARAGVAPPDAFRNYPTLLSASILGLRTKSRLLLILRHGPCFPIICIACSLPGNRRARSGFYRVSSAISGGPFILFPSGFILVGHCVPATWSVPSGRSNITSHYRPQAVQSLPLPR